jgi:hypothetical protein
LVIVRIKLIIFPDTLAVPMWRWKRQKIVSLLIRKYMKSAQILNDFQFHSWYRCAPSVTERMSFGSMQFAFWTSVESDQPTLQQVYSF